MERLPWGRCNYTLLQDSVNLDQWFSTGVDFVPQILPSGQFMEIFLSFTTGEALLPSSELLNIIQGISSIPKGLYVPLPK